ncbi:sugar transporter [Holotrichia oblita]|uniref:Sugar transporter n=1 Tax=Holotrichia oblita TaxID=644536 RepID=A0ACB9T556_HOLOL|nr:sugar transporter [Holotrichia oblita]
MEEAEDPILLKGEKLKQYVAAICVSLGAICAGCVLAWTSPALPKLVQDKVITPDQEGIVGSMLALGALISALPAGYFADKFGRKKTLISLAIPFMLNWILIVLANGPFMLYIARFLAGLAAGAMCVCAPMYIGEIAEASIRGALGSFFQMFICTGILLTAIFGSFLSWVWLSAFLGIFPIIFAASLFFMPETPIYLVKMRDLNEARQSLKYFRGYQYKYVDVELREIEKFIEEANANKAGIKDLFASRANKKAIISGVGIMIFQQFSGINAVIFYTVMIFKSAGSSLSPDLATIIVDIVQLVAAVSSVMLIERANRKFYLRLSSMGMCVCLAALGLYFHLQMNGVKASWLGTLPLASLVLFIVAFSMGFGPVPWMIMSELFAPEIKGVASGLAVMTNWICVFIVTFTFPLMNTHLGGHITFYIFAIIMIIGTIFVQLFVPETKGKTLQQIQEILNR